LGGSEARVRKRRTSIQVYHEIRDNGLLSQRRWEVYRWLYHNGPATGREAILGARKQDHGPVISQTRARLTELRDMGVIEELGTVNDKVTGNEVILWDVTDKLPRPLPPRVVGPTKKQLQDQIKRLVRENQRLRGQLQRQRQLSLLGGDG
jgi:hypothetical protein